MQTLILTDHDTTRNEQGLLARLAIALADAGVRATLATPSHLPTPTGVLCSTAVTYPARGLALSLSRRVREFVSELPEHVSFMSESNAEPTVVHVLGRGAWRFALRLREETGVPMVFELSRVSEVEALAQALSRADREAAGTPCVVSSSERLLERFRAKAPGVPTTLARWGVHASAEHGPFSSDEGVTSVGIFAPGGYEHEAGVRSILEAAAMLQSSYPDLLLFLDDRGAEHHAVWRAARRFGVLDRLTLVADVEHRAEHFLQTRFLVVPERLGGCRSILFHAMALGCPIIARFDPDADWLIGGQTAVVVGTASDPAVHPLRASVWADAIRLAMTDEGSINQIRTGALTYVRAKHSMPMYAKALLGAYERCVAEEAETAGPVTA